MKVLGNALIGFCKLGIAEPPQRGQRASHAIGISPVTAIKLAQCL